MRSWAILFGAACACAVTVPTAHFDNSRTNWNSSESILTPALLSSGGVGRLGSYLVDGAVRAQPLFIPNITVGGTGHDLLIVATMHNSVYAFDAHSPGTAALWHAGPLATSRTSWPGSGSGDNVAYNGGEVGCMATPVVDVSNSWIFASCHNSTPNIVLYKLNLATGATIASVTISGQVVGTGDPTGGDTVSGPNLLFYPTFELQRSAVTLAGGTVYLGFGSYNDEHPWHGWIIAYNESLTQTAIYCTTPNGFGGAVWQSGGGPAVDGSGNLFFATGNGDWDGSSNFGSSIVKLTSALALSDFWTPSNHSTLTTNDQDIGSGRVMLIPSTTWLAVGGKDYRVFSVDSTCMGHLQGGGSLCTAAQVFFTNASGPAGDNGIYGGLFFNGNGYWPNIGKIYRFSISGSTWNTSATTSANSFSFPGAQMSGSSNGSFGAVLWAITTPANSEITPQYGALRAFDPLTLNEFWTSDDLGNDTLGRISKFCAPTIANGNVYVGTLDNTVVQYGQVSRLCAR